MNRPHGFTQVELLTTLAVAALLVASAAGAASRAMSAVRSADAKAALTASVAIAVSKATIIGAHAVLCPSRNGEACDAGHDWSAGWMVFIDADIDRERDAVEPVVHRQPSLADEVALVSTSGRTRIVFQATGSNAGSNVTFTVCDGRGPAKAESLVMSNTGRFRVAAAEPLSAGAACRP